VFIIGGAKTFENFADLIETWIVTEIPISVDDADTFMPHEFLNGFELSETKQIGEELEVKILHRK
jgi:dihydrofolate reductase